MLSALASTSFGQKAIGGTKAMNTASATDASVVPVVFPFGNPGDPSNTGNPNCGTLNALHANGSGDTRFSHIITNDSLKLDFGTPNGTFNWIDNGGSQEVVGTEYPGQTVTVTSSGSSLLSWSSTMQITAVILKVGNQAYVYPYKPFAHSDTDLITGHQNAISHLTFCSAEPTGPTAADSSISGRVVDASGLGISKAQVVLVNGSTGETKITMTSPFGFYLLTDLDSSELYVLNVNHKRYTFAEPQRVISVADNLTEIDFMALPQQ